MNSIVSPLRMRPKYYPEMAGYYRMLTRGKSCFRCKFFKDYICRLYGYKFEKPGKSRKQWEVNNANVCWSYEVK